MHKKRIKKAAHFHISVSVVGFPRRRFRCNSWEIIPQIVDLMILHCVVVLAECVGRREGDGWRGYKPGWDCVGVLQASVLVQVAQTAVDVLYVNTCVLSSVIVGGSCVVDSNDFVRTIETGPEPVHVRHVSGGVPLGPDVASQSLEVFKGRLRLSERFVERFFVVVWICSDVGRGGGLGCLGHEAGVARWGQVHE